MAIEGILVILAVIAIGVAVYKSSRKDKKVEPWMSTMASSISHTTCR